MTAQELTQKELRKLKASLIRAQEKPFHDEQEIENLKEKIRLKVVILKCLEVYENMPANQSSSSERL